MGKEVSRRWQQLKNLGPALLFLGALSPLPGVFVFYAHSRIVALSYATRAPSLDELVFLSGSLLYGTIVTLTFLSASVLGLLLVWGPSRRRLLYALIGIHLVVGGSMGSILAANSLPWTPASIDKKVGSEREVLVSMRSAIIRGTATPSYIEVVIGVNNTVRWRNDPSSLHPEVLQLSWEPLFSSPLLPQGQTWAYTFSKPGTYHYYSVIHGGVEGTIVVNQQNQTKS